ncbi:MAG: hypothetical protein HY654_13670 [Acidobacteria bacterium]|nr:hypothetical protein [Acidobacteriota bacterium]
MRPSSLIVRAALIVALVATLRAQTPDGRLAPKPGAGLRGPREGEAWRGAAVRANQTEFAAIARMRGVPANQEKDAEQWVARTLKKMTLDEKIGQLLFPSISGVYVSVDSDEFDRIRHLIRDLQVGGFHVFGGSVATPNVLLNPAHSGSSAAIKGEPYEIAALLNRMQRESAVPLLTTADFEGGAAYIVNGATRLPRAMAMAATRDPDLAFQAGRIAATEGRSLGVAVNFYPVVDVNNNPRNPIINIRSFGEDVGLVSQMAAAYIRGAHAGGMLATAKHFPGHGDTAVDTHLGLALIEHPRARLDEIELPPFRRAIQDGVDAVMSSHIVLPSLDPTPGIPATLSRPILTGLLRDEMKFNGLVFTDSMSMYAISQNFTPARAAVLAVKAGADAVLHSPDDDAAFAAIKEAVAQGEIDEAQVTKSAERILRAKARLGLHKTAAVSLEDLPSRFGTREHQKLSRTIADRALTLLKDDRNQIPLKAGRDARLLYLSVLDYASGWREGAPSRRFIPELRQRWANVTSIELTDRTTAAELDLVRALSRHADVIVASVFVRIASYSGRMDLSPAQVSLLQFLSRQDKPFVTVMFGNPYAATFLPDLSTVLLTYETFDGAEAAAVRAIAGEIPITGKLPISLPGMFPFGHGLERGNNPTIHLKIG